MKVIVCVVAALQYSILRVGVLRAEKADRRSKHHKSIPEDSVKISVVEEEKE